MNKMSGKPLRCSIVNILILLSFSSIAQNDITKDSLPFQNIAEYPTSYSSEEMVARMIDGLGFRFYWATEGLRQEDLSFRPNPEARTSEETIDHVMGLSNVIINAVKIKPNTNSQEKSSPKSFSEKRSIILTNLFEARQILVSGTVKVEELKIIFERNDGHSELPVWNLINGPIADAIWHVGQLVSFRRSSSNPFNSKVNLMMGTSR